MNILVLNAGSGSQKASLFRCPDNSEGQVPLEPVWEARLDTTAPGQPPGKLILWVQRDGKKKEAAVMEESLSVEARTERMLRALWEGECQILKEPVEVDIVAHRVVHGGGKFDEAVWVDADVEAAIGRFSEFAPLHNVSNLTGIHVSRRLFPHPGQRQAAVFDTAFHRTLPDAAAVYGGPHDWLDKGLRRYGFHGTSFRYAAQRAAEMLGRTEDSELRLILCHLGGGCSLCATIGGRSVDTTMGLTPLDGLMMCTRSGAVDPGILIWLLRQGMSADEMEQTLNRQSGLKGLSGLSGDTRVLLPAISGGHGQARLALEVFLHRLRGGIGQMLAALGAAPHAIIFTDAISEDEPSIREAACASFGFLGLKLDSEKNARSPLDADIATADSAVRVLLIQSREAWQIAIECLALVRRSPAHKS